MANLLSPELIDSNNNETLSWDKETLAKYNTSGPRYTSYPTALQFHEEFGEEDYTKLARASNDHTKPLSLYLHLPFCESLCYYCACNKIITKNRYRSTEYLNFLIKEIKLQSSLFSPNRPVIQLHWGGGSPTYFSDEDMTMLMHTTARCFNLLEDDQGDYSIEIDPRSVDKNRPGLIRGLGFNRVSLGVQDFNPKVQQAINRAQPFGMVCDLVEQVRNYKFKSMSFDLIYGLPHQTPDSFADTIEKVIALSPDRISLFNYAHMPNRFKNQRLILQETLPDPQEKLSMLCQSSNELIQAGYEYIGFDHFAKPDDELAQAQNNGSLQRNFQGYSTSREADLIGMGVSSISKISDAYSQNYKSVKNYEESLLNNHLPIERGYILNQDDRIRQAVIESLTCHNMIDIDNIETQFNLGFNDYFSQVIPELNTLAEDGLIEKNGKKWLVSPKGRVLIRNICMVFDKYLLKNVSANSQTFSRTI